MKNRKTLYIVLSILLIFIFTLTIVYAALNTVLKITGTAEISSASWDIYLDNVQLISGSATTSVPTITNKTTASFTTTLTNPGDYYMFTIDVVNNGTIDAMIDSIEKTSLSESQSKYLNYTVEYQNGESISTKQLVEQNSFVRLKVKVEYRKDLVASDLPSTTENITLSFTVKYIQAEENGTSSVPNAGKIVEVVKGDYDTVGSEVCIESECFYVISSTDEEVTMLAKYNLLVGNKYDSTNGAIPLESPTGIQNSKAIGMFSSSSESNPAIGTVTFSNKYYWYNNGLKEEYGTDYPAYVYDSNASIFTYVENYKNYLINLGMIIEDARLISYEELEQLGCDGTTKNCNSAPEWVISTSYWTGSVHPSGVWMILSWDAFSFTYFFDSDNFGVRPVITISKSEF